MYMMDLYTKELIYLTLNVDSIHIFIIIFKTSFSLMAAVIEKCFCLVYVAGSEGKCLTVLPRCKYHRIPRQRHEVSFLTFGVFCLHLF